MTLKPPAPVRSTSRVAARSWSARQRRPRGIPRDRRRRWRLARQQPLADMAGGDQATHHPRAAPRPPCRLGDRTGPRVAQGFEHPAARSGQRLGGGRFGERGETRRGRRAQTRRGGGGSNASSTLIAMRSTAPGGAQRIGGDALDKTAQLRPQRWRRQGFAERLQPLQGDRRPNSSPVPSHTTPIRRRGPSVTRQSCRARGMPRRPAPGSRAARARARAASPEPGAGWRTGRSPVSFPGAVGTAIGHRYTRRPDGLAAGRSRSRRVRMSAGHESGVGCR